MAFIKIDHMLKQKRNLSRCEIMEIMQSMFSDHSGTKLEKKSRKFLNILNLSEYFQMSKSKKKNVVEN